MREVEVTMPKVFRDQNEYLEKLKEVINAEAEINRLSIESIAEAGIRFEFEEVLEIYCRMRLRVPKTNQQFLKEHTALEVVIPIENDFGSHYRWPEYVGVGIIKKVTMAANDPFLTVIF